MAATQPGLREKAKDPFRGGSDPDENPFSGFGAAAANEDAPKTGLTIERVEDLVVDLGHGNEEAVPYKLYTGSSLIRKGGIRVVRFHERFVFVEGIRLKPIRDAVSNKRCGHLRSSSRMERINAEKSGEPIITALRVVKPKQGNNELALLIEGKALKEFGPSPT